jgi:hypothetical protein
MNMNTKTSLIFLAVTIIMAVGAICFKQTMAISPYQSGYKHGCSDAETTGNAPYINSPGHGPSFHTHEFMNGYKAGYAECAYHLDAPTQAPTQAPIQVR